MSKIITRLYDEFYDGEHAVLELRRIGVPDHDISLVSRKSDGEVDGVKVREPKDHTAGGAAAIDGGAGFVGGGIIGAAGGTLAGLGLLAIPGLGPVIAAGWLASAAVGAVVGGAIVGAAGGLVGALTHAGVSKDEADVYAEGVRRGGTLVSAKVEDAKLASAEAALNSVAHVNIGTRGADYRSGGWTGFNADLPPYGESEIAAERAKHPAH
jgi:hypothetical protein